MFHESPALFLLERGGRTIFGWLWWERHSQIEPKIWQKYPQTTNVVYVHITMSSSGDSNFGGIPRMVHRQECNNSWVNAASPSLEAMEMKLCYRSGRCRKQVGAPRYSSSATSEAKFRGALWVTWGSWRCFPWGRFVTYCSFSNYYVLKKNLRFEISRGHSAPHEISAGCEFPTYQNGRPKQSQFIVEFFFMSSWSLWQSVEPHSTLADVSGRDNVKHMI